MQYSVIEQNSRRDACCMASIHLLNIASVHLRNVRLFHVMLRADKEKYGIVRWVGLGVECILKGQ